MPQMPPPSRAYGYRSNPTSSRRPVSWRAVSHRDDWSRVRRRPRAGPIVASRYWVSLPGAGTPCAGEYSLPHLTPLTSACHPRHRIARRYKHRLNSVAAEHVADVERVVPHLRHAVLIDTWSDETHAGNQSAADLVHPKSTACQHLAATERRAK
jgi:hypothetical protein